MSKIVAVLGAGSFGTAIAQLLAGNGSIVNLWDHDAEVIQAMNDSRENKKYAPGIPLHANIQPVSELAQAVCNVQYIFEAIPVAHLRSVLEQARSCARADQVWVIMSKGIEDKTLLFPTQIVDDVFDCEVKKAILAGPSFAHEIMQRQITGVTVGATDCLVAQTVQQMLSNDFFHVSITDDLMGVQLGAAFKNVISLGVGMLDGAGYGDNTKAFILTLGLQEAMQCAVALGGRAETLYGLSGVGDLVLTSMGKSSRNREIGKRIGRGESVAQIVKHTGYTAEGLNTLKSIMAFAEKYDLHLPLCAGITGVVYQEKSIKEMMHNIFSDAALAECKWA